MHATKTGWWDIIEVMEFVHVIGYYILWHYTKAWKDFLRVMENYLWFVGNYFSINLLLGTLFAPWRRLHESGGKGTKESFLGAFLINTLMRFVGFGARLFIIISGAFSLLLIIALGFVAAIAWLLLPVIVFLLFFAGVGYVTSALI